MSEPANGNGPYSLPIGQDVYRIVVRLRLVGGLVLLALGLTVLLAAGGFLLRAFRPVDGGVAAVILAGAVAVLALAGGTVALEVTSRKARKAGSLEGAVAVYRLGCAIAGAVNAAAALVALIVLYANGISGGLWIPLAIVLVLNLLGMALAVPRVRQVRRLHYRPTLPISRI
mgnify:CR=1 FL=1